MEDINRRFGANLRKLREKHKLTQEQLAQLSEIDYKYIQRLEGKAPSSPSLNIIEKFAKAFKIHPSQLLKF
ncbi:MAG: helix-turn-helix transcriptional regulator [Candidatus Omnitrophica bacterium]|nr:helix-turn-helix transcriptional regulator [Candidatus Omnitrophota bacterium]